MRQICTARGWFAPISFAAGLVSALACSGAGAHPPSPAGPATPSATAPRLEPAIRGLPDVRAGYRSEPEFAGRYYLVTAGPRRSTRPPVLFVHGLGDHAGRDWHPVLGSIAAHRRIVVVDLPGFGRSDRGNELYDPRRYAKFLAHVIRHEVGQRVDVVGHSMGGAISIALAAMEPSLVRRLVLADVAGILSEESLVDEWLQPPPWEREGSPRQATSAILRELVIGLSPLMPDPARILTSEWARDTFLSGDPMKIAALALLATEFDPLLGRVRCPTALLWGAHDAIAPLRTKDLLAGELPISDVLVLPGIGHNPMREAPDRTAAAISAHLNATTVRLAPRPAPKRSARAKDRRIQCDDDRPRQLTGAFERLEIVDCPRFTLRNATARSVVLRRSQLETLNVDVDAGVQMVDSRLRATSGRLRGNPAIAMTRSSADLAGVGLISDGVAFEVVESARLITSVSHLERPGAVDPLHGVWQLEPGQISKLPP